MTHRARAALVAILALSTTSAFAQDAPAPQTAAGAARAFARDVRDDFSHLFSADNARVLGIFSVATIGAVPWDQQIDQQLDPWPDGAFEPGRVIGNLGVQTALGALTWGLGRVTHHAKAADVGRDLVRAQLLAGAPTLLLKVTVRRERPDGSNAYSFPSGHSSSAFAMASTLQRHLGWKAGVPAYGVAIYVATARLVEHKHYLSDVVMGAGLGLVGGGTATLRLGGSTFGVGVSPAPGGAALTITRFGTDGRRR